MSRSLFVVVIGSYQLSALLVADVRAQERQSRIEGMWSDPPVSIFDTFCQRVCTDVSLARLEALLDDPANADRPLSDLASEAQAYAIDEYVRPRLTEAALEDFPLDPADDPSFLECEPYGIAAQVTARHQVQFRHEDDRIEMQYGEWAARRTIYMDGRQPPEGAPHTAMGFSVGRFEGDELVIETSHISPRAIRRVGYFRHSDQLRLEERYSVSEDGQLLTLTITYEDPWSLKEPLVAKKVWGWAPDEEIYPELDCEVPTDFFRRGEQP